ncbi:MAG: sulfatase-like hydrolase/transferase [Planctomycetes bacterium]|jgi:arylsulfatase A-like enzyme|nr:sulfatase-like hydrolase/transferase [Planctomycetota bacterium]
MKILAIETWGLNLAYVGCYGNDWVATPNLDRLAAEGIVFDNHIVDQPELRAGTPWHQRSVGTGRYALPGTSPSATNVSSPRVVWLESMSSFGNDALALLECGDPWLWLEGPSLLPPWDRDLEILATYFAEDDAEDEVDPWPDPPMDFVQLEEIDVLRLQNTYAGVVTEFDAQLGILLDELRKNETLDAMLVCVTARTGLPLCEHGVIGTPHAALHDELVHVPLIMRLPRAADAGLRINALTQPIDLLPTFLESLSQAVPPMQGKSLWPLMRGDVRSLRSHALASMRIAGYETWLMRTLDAALHVPIAQPGGIEATSPQLFLKPEDRWEVNDLRQHLLETADEMEKTLRASCPFSSAQTHNEA